MGKFENTPLSYGHSSVTIETLGFQLALKWNTYVQPCMERISAFFHAVESIDFTTTVWSKNIPFNIAY